MSEANEFKYCVIQFSEVPYKDVADYVCVPRSWVHARGPNDRKVKVSYPIENPLDTEKRVMKRKKKSDEWNSYLSVIKYSTDDYNDAILYIQRMIPSLQNEDKTLRTQQSVEENPRRSTRKNKKKSANTTILIGNALPDLDEESHNKRCRVTELDESDDEVMVPASQVFETTSEGQSLPHEVFKKDQRKPETTIDDSNNENSSENVPTVNHNPAEENHYLIPEKFAKHNLFVMYVLRYLRTNLPVYITSVVTDAVTKAMNDCNTACRHDFSISSLTKTSQEEAPTLINKRKINEMHSKQKDTDDDDDEDQPLKKISRPKIIKKIVLPAEYDEHDSKWTVKYREPAPELVELMEYSRVYVKALELTKCMRVSKDCKSLARMLLCEIFTRSALGTCSWTGERAKAFHQDGDNVRPGLDEHARTVLMNYVAEHARKERWTYENYTILSSIRNKMQEIRVKYESKLFKSKRTSKQK